MSLPMRKSASQTQPQQTHHAATSSLNVHKRFPSTSHTPPIGNNHNITVAGTGSNAHLSRPSTPAATAATHGHPLTSTPKSQAMAKSMSTGTKSFGSPAAASQASPLTNLSVRSPAVSSSLQHSVSAGTGGTGGANGGPRSVPPMASTPTPGGATNAPSTGPALNFDSPSGLSGFMQSLEQAGSGGTGMSLSLSNLGLNMGLSASGGATGSAMGRAQDDAERRRRLEAVLEELKKRPGRISREGLERLGRRCEMDVVPEGPNKLSLGGRHSVVLDVEFAPDASPLVEHVALSFPSASEESAERIAKASRILRKDLTPPKGVSFINATLDKFADNLERLAILDKLSAPGADCFEAVLGVYASLKRLYEHERQAAEQLFGGDSERAERHVLCRKSGQPEMHARRRIGLSLSYWRDGRLIPSTATSTGDSNNMEIDSELKTRIDDSDEDLDSEQDEFYSLVVECEPTTPALYPPMRVSSEWLASNVTAKPMIDISMEDSVASEEVIDWLEPNAIVLPKPEPIDGVAASPQVQARFVARFEPALVLPIQIAAQVYNSFGLHWPPPAELLRVGAYEHLVLGLSPTDEEAGNILEQDMYQHRTFQRNFTAFDESNEVTEEVSYRLGLFTPRAGTDTSYMSVVIESLPFTHPRQLVEALPTFRVFAFTSSLLKHSFPLPTDKLGTGTRKKTNGAEQLDGDFGVKENEKVDEEEDEEDDEDDDDDDEQDSDQDDLTRLLVPRSSSATSNQSRSKKVDVFLTLHLSTSSTTDKAHNGSSEVIILNQTTIQPQFTVMMPDKVQAQVTISTNGIISVALPSSLLSSSSLAASALSGDRAVDAQSTTAATVDGGNEETGGAEIEGDETSKLAQGLEVAEDLAIWAEWISRRRRGTR